MALQKSCRIGLILGACLMFSHFSLAASLTTISTRATLGGTDYIDWGQVGPDFTEVSAPVNVTSNGGLAATVNAGGRNFDAVVEGNTFAGNFAVGDNLLFCCDLGSSPTTGSYSISFSTPIQGLGMQFASLNTGPFVASIDVYDASANLLGTVTANGNTNTAEDNSAVFLGVISSDADISAIHLNVVDGSPSADDSFAINRMDLVPAPSTNAAPEPSTLLLLAGGAIPVYVLRRRTGSRNR